MSPRDALRLNLPILQSLLHPSLCHNLLSQAQFQQIKTCTFFEIKTMCVYIYIYICHISIYTLCTQSSATQKTRTKDNRHIAEKLESLNLQHLETKYSLLSHTINDCVNVIMLGQLLTSMDRVASCAHYGILIFLASVFTSTKTTDVKSCYRNLVNSILLSEITLD